MSLGQFWNRKAKPLAKVPRYTALVGAEMTPERVSRIRATYTRPWSETSLTDALWRQTRKRYVQLMLVNCIKPQLTGEVCACCGHELTNFDYAVCPCCRMVLP